MKESRFFEEALEEGRREGALITRRAYIQQVLEIRFGKKAAAALRDAVGKITDMDRLSKLYVTAIRCRRIAEFRRVLEAGDSTG
jgi:hypothetical protein